jgi:hypothetical protein
MLRFATRIALSMAFFTLAGSHSVVLAGSLVQFQAGDYSASQLANNGVPSLYDTLDITGQGGLLDLKPGVPSYAVIGSLSFNAGPSSYGEATGSYATAGPNNTNGTNDWTITVNGVTKALEMPFTASSLYAGDRIVFDNSSPLSFKVGNDTLTLVGLATTMGPNFGGIQTGQIEAEFTLAATPEPSSLALGAMGALGALGYAWRRYRRTACP